MDDDRQRHHRTRDHGLRRHCGHQPQQRRTGGLRCVAGLGFGPVAAIVACRRRISARRRSAGTTDFAAGTYTITAAGADIWDTSDQFRYVYQQVSGDIDVVARVASLTAADVWTKAGVMIRESLSAGSRHAMAVVTAQNGYVFQRRVDTSSFSEHTAGGAGAAPQWVRLVRTGSQFQAFRSANGQTWTLMGTDTIPMGSTAYVGIAVTSHNPCGDDDGGCRQFHGQRRAAHPESAAGRHPDAAGQRRPVHAGCIDCVRRDRIGSGEPLEPSRVFFGIGPDRFADPTHVPYSATWTPVRSRNPFRVRSRL